MRKLQTKEEFNGLEHFDEARHSPQLLLPRGGASGRSATRLRAQTDRDGTRFQQSQPNEHHYFDQPPVSVEMSFTVVDELLAAKRSLRATRHHTELLLHFLKRLENNAGQRLVVRALGSTNHERISIPGLGRKTFQRRSRGKQGTQMIPMGIQQRKSQSCFEKIGLHIDGLRRNGEWAEDNMRYGNVIRK
nr:hypothetical protein Iba_chr05aCG15330 [Ipomoea batatas]